MSTRKERAAYIGRKLDEIYPEVEIPLDHRGPYTLLIAAVLSAQCTDARVNEVTPILFGRADTPRKMAALDVDEIGEIIASCGLANTKARNIKALSGILTRDYRGKVPRDFERLESLPGVGHKTASIIMGQAFGVPAFPVDTHIHRLAQRWRLTSGKNVRRTEEDLKKLFPAAEWTRRHIQIILYGRQYCSARGCDGSKCEICRGCFPRRRPVATRKA